MKSKPCSLMRIIFDLSFIRIFHACQLIFRERKWQCTSALSLSSLEVKDRKMYQNKLTFELKSRNDRHDSGLNSGAGSSLTTVSYFRWKIALE
jgi:hypothetical protein